MTWSFLDNQDSFLANMLIRAVGALPPDIKARFYAREHGDNYDIHFVVDGFELPLEASFDEIERQLDDMIKREAVKLLDDKLDEHYYKLTDIAGIVDNACKQICQEFMTKLGITLREDED